jgi:uncharacterized membrane protein YphA (DoxX/SURF4 family)
VTAPARAGDLGLLALRLALAAVFAVHGYVKILGGHFDRTVALFMTVNIPAPEAMTWVIGVLELGCGVLLALGFWVRPLAALLAAEMAVVLVKVRWAQGFLGAAEFEIVLLAACLALTATGAGKFSLGASPRGASARARRRLL